MPDLGNEEWTGRRYVCTAAQLRKALGIEESTFTTYRAARVLAQGRKQGEYYLIPSINGVVDYLRQRRHNARTLDDKAATARKRSIEADIKEMELQRLRGELFAAESVVAGFATLGVVVARHAKALPSRLAPLLGGETRTAAEVRAVAMELIAEWMGDYEATLASHFEEHGLPVDAATVMKEPDG